jgi:hypothetical protein
MICSVCGKENDTMLCAQCGFDGSCDYEKYPSLARPVKRPAPVSRYRAVQKENSAEKLINILQANVGQRNAAQKANDSAILRCAKCGGIQFSVDVKTGELLCSACGHRFSMADSPAQAAPKRAEPVKDSPVSKPVAPTPPPVSKPVTPPTAAKPEVSTAPPATQTVPAKRRRGMLEKLTLGLGWILAGLIAFAILEGIDQGAEVDTIAPVAGFFILNLIMQVRILRKGFCPLFGDKVPYGLHNFCYVFMALDFAVTAFVGFGFVNVPTESIFSQTEHLILITLVVVIPLYFAFWALGQRGSRKKK